MKAGVIVFPGSNCDRDVADALKNAMGTAPQMVWHADTSLPKLDLVVVPGGFSYGDYLRSGAIAAQSPIMREVVTHANNGGYVLGVCNGFQVLTEAKLLPGTLLRNRGLKFICRDLSLKVENTDTAFTKGYDKGQVITIPVAHHDGNYFIDADGLKTLEGNGQVAFRYSDTEGAVNDNTNPNGSLGNIAGIFNEKKTILGMMPHPERLADAAIGGTDGKALFDSLVKHFS
ncbi:MAG: phosphoribosylformylglycinamidine synthase subunit PurQ [Proteobacteria bacterium]|nr:phosphoribosylformylglycinamidine synthase subunit PurQ [Pseudomonadota bacterium]